MKLRRSIVAIVILTCLLTACSSSSPSRENGEEGAFSDYQKGFINVLGNLMVETPDGYYFWGDSLVMHSYLRFMDKEMKQWSFVCSKPDCLHDKEGQETMQQCDAYFSQASAVNYYNGKIYVSADSSQKPGEQIFSIYELDPDGSNRKKVYTAEGTIESFCIHRGNMIVDEKKYTEENTNPVIMITMFPVEKPEEKVVLYEESGYQDLSVSYFQCYKDYCYFELSLRSEEESETHCIIINLDTKEVKDCYEFANNSIVVGNDRIYCRNVTEIDDENQTWKDEYYECSLDGEIQKKVEKSDWEPLKNKAILTSADDQYLYFRDITNEENTLSEEEQKFYICTYDGKIAGTVSYQNFTQAFEILSGNSEFFLIIDVAPNERGTISPEYYKVDKSQIGGGKELIPEKIFGK